MNCETAPGSQTPFSSPSSPFHQLGAWHYLDLDPVASRDLSRSLLEALASMPNEALARGLNEALDQGARLRGLLIPFKLLLLCHQEYENTRLESELMHSIAYPQ